MKEIVCDTNVWYDLPDNYSVENARLIPTFCNVHELVHSENLVNRFEAGIKAIKSIYSRSYLENHNRLNPLAHLMFLESGEAPQPPEEKELIDVFFQLAKDEISQDVLLAKILSSKDAQLRQVADFFNQVLVKEEITLTDNREESIEWTKNFMALRVHQWAETIGVEYHMRTNFDWNRIELFLNVQALFLRKKVFNKMKYQPKDLFDLLNMIYVRPGNLYWTKEGQDTNRLRWHNLIKEAGMEHYLFNQ